MTFVASGKSRAAAGTGGQSHQCHPSREPPAPTEKVAPSTSTPYDHGIKQILSKNKSSLLQTLTVRDGADGEVFRYWQEGPGYDRNLNQPRSVLASIDYLHLNPVRRGLCQRADQWKWSSARWYLSDGQHQDDDLPHLERLPAELFHG
jgi:putative transposase